MKIEPLNDWVLVRELSRQSVTSRGIVVPASMEDRNRLVMAQVVAVGKGRCLEASDKRRSIDISKGDYITYCQDVQVLSTHGLPVVTGFDVEHHKIIDIDRVLGKVILEKADKLLEDMDKTEAA